MNNNANRFRDRDDLLAVAFGLLLVGAIVGCSGIGASDGSPTNGAPAISGNSSLKSMSNAGDATIAKMSAFVTTHLVPPACASKSPLLNPTTAIRISAISHAK